MSGAFHTKNFAERFEIMGDTAEAVFDKVYPKSHELGLNRPPFTMSKMTPQMRATPDRMTATHIVEVMGMGRDGRLKLKNDKMNSLNIWEAIGPVNLFVYDSSQRVYYEASIGDWIRAAVTHGSQRVFENDGNPYYELESIFFPTDPIEAPV
jgi:hypothetical protein